MGSLVDSIQILPKTGSGQLDELANEIPQLNTDILRDACSENYGPECTGTSSEVDALEHKLAAYEAETEDVGYGVEKVKNPPLDAKSVLTMAGVEPTDTNVKAFGACVKARLSKAASTARGTLAYCALVVKNGTKAEKAHSTQDWRDKWETWRRTFEVFKSKIDDQVTPATAEEVKPYVVKYNALREAFIDEGGETTAKGIFEPRLVPVWLYVAAAGAMGLWVWVQARAVVR